MSPAAPARPIRASIVLLVAVIAAVAAGWWAWDGLSQRSQLRSSEAVATALMESAPRDATTLLTFGAEPAASSREQLLATTTAHFQAEWEKLAPQFEELFARGELTTEVTVIDQGLVSKTAAAATVAVVADINVDTDQGSQVTQYRLLLDYAAAQPRWQLDAMRLVP